MEKKTNENLVLSDEITKVNKLLQRKVKHAQRYLEKGKKDLEKAKSWNFFHHQGELLQANLYQIEKGAKETLVYDWEQDQNVMIVLDHTKSPYEIVKELFRKAKKLKSSISHLEKYLKKKQIEIDAWHKHLDDLNRIESFEALISFQKLVLGTPKCKETKKKEKREPYFEFHTASGLKIFVGRTAKDNEFVTFSLARGNDWWLHVRDFPGSHVVIRVRKGEEPDPESLQDAIQLALYNSKARIHGEGEVYITQKKYVSRLSGAKPGTVQISKHKSVFVRFNKDRFVEFTENQKIKN